MAKNHKIKKIICIVGARPNFIKIAPLLEEFKKYRNLKPILVHTGQHYNYQMSKNFFKELNIPKPDYNLKIGSGSHTWQIAKIMLKLEAVALKEKPNLIVVAGDVNSTLAGALAAAKLQIPIAHIEAGLRSFDNSMPEEINRKITDSLSDYLFVTEPSGVENLLNEGISKKKIFFVGNIMIDTLIKSKIKWQKSKVLKKLNLQKQKYAILTLHRPHNVDNIGNLKNLFQIFKELQEKIQTVFPVHPRTRKNIENAKIKTLSNILLTDPLGYIEFIALLANAKFVLTDSGGIQEEATFLKIPCLTLRKNTERPITVEKGTNTLCWTKPLILKKVNDILNNKLVKTKKPQLWDGKTAERIVEIIFNEL